MHASSGPTIDALLADRARFESWLTQLDHKAGGLPSHIVTRVRADYTDRLQRVLDALAERADDLRAEAAELAERVAALEVALSAKRDARAEDELRAIVGEFDDAAWAARAAQHDAAIAALDGELQTRIAERDRAQELVSSAVRSDAPPVPAAPAQDSPPRVAPPPTPPVAPPAIPPAPVLPPAAAPRVSAPVPRAEQLPIDVPAAAASTPAVDSGTSIPDLLPSPTFDSPPKRSSQQTAFDEMAFLDTVVGGGPDRGADGSAEVAEGAAAQLAAPAESEAEGQRTLKCQECGWMNVPTEWYCEKCGGELSAF